MRTLTIKGRDFLQVSPVIIDSVDVVYDQLPAITIPLSHCCKAVVFPVQIKVYRIS